MASIYGAFNKIEDAGSSNDSGRDIDGLGNSVNGSLNITSNARGTMIMGVGNTVTHAKGPDILGKDEDTPGATDYWVSSGLVGADYYGQGADTEAEGNNLNISFDEMRNSWQKYMETSGGAVSVLGNSNNADYAIRSQIIGTGNTINGSEKNVSAYNTVSGFANTGTNIKRSAIVGTGNTLKNGEDNVVIGDYHNLENGKHNVILGSMDFTEKQVTKQSKSAWAMTNEHPDGTFEYTVTEQVPVKDHTKDIENAVMVGYNTDVTQNGGVALGSDSVASTEAGIAGFDPQSRKHVNSEKDYSTWVSTDAAVSVGGADREVTYDVLDKDGKPVIDKATGKKKQETQIVKSTRQITNLAAGTEDTDAVNVAQLKSVNQKVAVVFDDKSSLMSTDATISHQILEDPGSFPEGEGQSIALGKNAHAYMQGGSKAQLMLFGMKKAAGAIAIGEGSEALSQSIDIGNRTYTGDMGDVTISKYGNGGSGSGVASVLLGTNSYTGGTLSTLIGDYSIMSTSYPNGNSAAYTQNAGAVSIGAFNSIESATSTNTTSGVANSIVGLANRTQNANGALIYGAGNEITDSIATASAPGYGSSAKAAANDLRQSVKSNPGGAALAIGGGNKIDKSIRTQTMGVNNEVTGSLYHEDAKYEEFFGHKIESSPEVNEYSSQYNMVDGYNNKVSNTNNAYVIGTNNTILGKTFSADTKDGTLSKADRTKAKESDNLVIIGDNHTMNKDVKNNIVIGTSDKALTTSVSDAVLLGHNADVQKEGGVALGADSVAAIDKDAVGYDPANGDHQADTTGTWKSTAAAVSVGDASKKITRQITNVAAGTQDTDAVNVAQLKAAQTHFYSVNSTDEKAGNYNNDGAKGKNSLAAGVGALANGSNSVAIGTKAKAQNDALAVGESASAGNTGIAIGMHANAGYGQNMALGYYASVANGVTNSTALGYGSQVTKRDILKSYDHDGVISVGKSVGQSGEKGMTRRIINVKAGVKATDAANVSQLTELKEGEHIRITDSATNEKGQTVKTISVKVDGQIEKGNTGILSGDTVYKEVHVDKDGNYIKSGYTVAENLNALDGKVKTNADNIEKNGQAIEKNSARIDTNSKNIEKNSQAIEKNSARIDTNAKNIEKNSQAIEKNSARIDTNAKNIEKNSQAIEKNSARIDTNSKNIEKNGQAIEKNSARIDTNSKNIEKNGQAIEKNSARIDTNSKNIEKNGQAIEKNSARIDTNSKNIEKNGQAIEKNSARIDTNSKNIEKNGQAIEKNSARIDTNSKNIEKNGQAIEKNSARIDTNSKNIEKNGQAIEKNSARIDTNSKNIEKNSQAIEKNSTRIDTNSNNIETLQKTKADTNLSNITDAGKTVINNIAKKSVKVEAGSSNVSVTTKDVADGPITYTVDVAKDLHVNSITSKTVTSDSVTAKTVTSDTVKTKNLSVSESASIDDVTINKGNQGTIDGLKNTAWDAKNITSGRAATEDQVKAATKNAVNYDDDTSKTITLREDTTIKNVANTAIEQGSKNAVNAGTVYNETRVKQDGKYVKASNTAGENLSVLDNQVASNSSNITNLNGRVNNLDSKVNKVGAGAAALAALHPLDFDPDDKWDFAVGYGNYRDANSVAVGAFYRPDDDTMFSVGTNFGNGENMINAGVSFKFGPKGKSQVRPGSTQEITELRATVARQDDQLKKQDSEIKELKAMVQQLMAKQDKQATTK